MARAGDSAARAVTLADPSEQRASGSGGTPRARGKQRPRSSRLSAKELAVLGQLACGYTTEEIAVNLVVSPHTVRTHVKNGMRKLDARTRAHAVAIALADGVIVFRG